MYNKTTLLLVSLMLQGCPDYFSKHSTDDTGHFSDASACYQSSLRKEQIKVPTAGTMTVVEVPTTYDAGAFSLCMEYKGHPVAKANADDYLNVSRACLQEARHAEKPDDAYAACVQHGGLTVEAFPKEKANSQ